MAEETPAVRRSPRDAHASQNGEVANGTGLVPERTGTRPRVALIGHAGAGKSALARALFGERYTPTANGAIEHYQDDATPVIVDDLPGWASGSESGVSALFSYLDNARTTDSRLSAIWYTLDAASARVSDYELQLIRRLARQRPVIVVLTRSDLVTDEALAAMRAAIEQADIPNCVGVVAVAADPLPALGLAPYGADDVMALTTHLAEQPLDDLPAQPVLPAKSSAHPLDRPPAPGASARPRQSQLPQPPTRVRPGRPAAERTGNQPQPPASLARDPGSTIALITVLVLVSLVLALVLLGRRGRKSVAPGPRKPRFRKRSG